MSIPEGIKRIPVILDTDIGSDIDDTWALSMLLNSPELDLRLVVTTGGDTAYRAKIAAKLLEVAGRTDVPVAIGETCQENWGEQQEWVDGYFLSCYPGQILEDGAAALGKAVLSSADPVTVVSIGPLTTLARALALYPDMAARARFVGMHGSLRMGYNGSPDIADECNVVLDPAACAAVFAAPWQSVTITPLDTCGLVRLTGEPYRQVQASPSPVTQALLDNYRIWARHVDGDHPIDTDTGSSILYDTVAVYLAFDESLVTMETLGIRVTDQGFTLLDPAAKPIRCATAWCDMEAFKTLLVNRLI